jgi:hypothetical protein
VVTGGRVAVSLEIERSPLGDPEDGRRPMTTAAGLSNRLVLAASAAAVSIFCGLVAGCSSSGAPAKPAYCTAADKLKTSVSALGNADVVKNGLSSVSTAVSDVKTNATTFANEAKSTFKPQTTALKQSLTSLDTAIKSANGQSVLTVAKTLAAPLTQVKTSATQLLNAVSDKCK